MPLLHNCKEARENGGSGGGEFVDAWVRAEHFVGEPIGHADDGTDELAPHADNERRVESIHELWAAHLSRRQVRRGEKVVPIVIMLPGGAGERGHFPTCLKAS